jgi:hypothetical protein
MTKTILVQRLKFLEMHHPVLLGKKKKMVKQSLYRSGEVLRFVGGRGSQISRQETLESVKVSRTHRPPLPPGNIPGSYSC